MESLRLTDEDFDKILFNRFDNPYITCKKVELSPKLDKCGLSKGHHLLKIYYQLDQIEQHETFFVKHRTDNAESEQKHRHEKEIFFYGFLLKEFEKLGLDTTFAPKCYLIKDEETIVLENLEGNGFVSKYEKFNMEEMKSCLDCLASYHGFTIVYELEKSKEVPGFSLLQKYPNVYGTRPAHVASSKELHETNVELLMKLIEEFSTGGDDVKRKLIEFDYNEIFESGFRKISTHGGLSSSNIMFKKLNTKRLKANLVDFRLIAGSCPAHDLLLLIYFNAEKEIKENKIFELFDYYYEQLSRVLVSKGYEPGRVLPKTELIDTIDPVKYFAMFHVAVNKPIIALPDFVFRNVPNDMKRISLRDKYDLVKKTMSQSEEYKQIIFECLEDLQIVFKNDFK